MLGSFSKCVNSIWIHWVRTIWIFLLFDSQGLQHVYKFNGGYNILCEPVNFSSDEIPLLIANGCHTYFLLKVADLLDTVFFVLRKKQNQISFLHLYHHTGMVILTWNATKFQPGGHSIFTGFLNSIIHVVMYGYYLVSAFNPEYKNNIWWKKYITQMQIVSWTVSRFTQQRNKKEEEKWKWKQEFNLFCAKTKSKRQNDKRNDRTEN